jgi:predicted permease
VLAFTLAACVGTGLLFGLAPTLATPADLATALKLEARSVAGGGGVLFRRGLVVGQMFLSLLLLVAAGLFLASLLNLRRVDPGLRPRNVIAFSVNPSLNGYGKERSRQYYRELMEKVRATPGVESAAAAAIRVLDDDWWSSAVTVEGRAAAPGDPSPNFNLVSSGYFTTLGIPLLAGRDFSAGDADSAQGVAIVNESFVRSYFGGKSPPGRRLALGNDPGTIPNVEIVGVAKDAKYSTVREEIRSQVFLDDDQNPDIQQVNVYIRTPLDARATYSVVRRALHELDPNVPVFGLRTMEEQVDRSLARDRVVASLAAAFGVLATLLAAVGLYGVMAFSVARRTREIGVRMALGAQRPAVYRLVLGEAAWVVGSGTVAGLIGAVAAATLMRRLLFGVRAWEAPTLATAAAVLVVSALLAAYVPARRAASVNPIEVLRAD